MKDIRVSFHDTELARYLGLAKRAHALKIYPIEPALSQKLDLPAAKKVDASPWALDPKSVKIRN